MKLDPEIHEARCRSVATHEAGHVVANVLLYPPGTIAFATIEPVANPRTASDAGVQLDGLVRTNWLKHLDSRIPPRGRGTPLALKRCALAAFGIQAYAGIAAQYRDVNLRDIHVDLTQPVDRVEAEDDEVFGPIWEHSESDRENLEWFARWLGARRRADRWHGASWRRARALVVSHWDAVEAVSEALLSRRRIDGAQAERLVLSAGEGQVGSAHPAHSPSW